MLASILHKHTARRAVHTAVNVAKIGGSMRDNGNRCYISDNLPAVVHFHQGIFMLFQSLKIKKI